MCRIPPSVNLQTARYTDRTSGVFSQSSALTKDGSISIVPTPGHSNGHQSVMIEDEGKSVCIVGDAAFTLNQVIAGEIGGIVENYSAAVQSSVLLKTQVEQFGTVLLPTHDPDNAERMINL
jgi:glyoxylase-like metal-dependent hydrolase (beta-lactamase superfamily II)